MATLYIVATPIGNLEDITLRALNILKSVDIIACEDTRHTQKLLNKYEIRKRLIATHAHNEKESANGIVSLLDQGNDIAFVSDAGTPAISDPGARLVSKVRQEGYDVVAIPGASAIITLISISGYVGKTFTFEGFLPIKKGKRNTRLTQLIERDEAFVIYESPYRVLKTLKEIASIDETRVVVVARELTKAHEEVLRNNIVEIINDFESRAAIKGEFAICVCPSKASEEFLEKND
ncbi:MAG: 16S rRNA (cytidine(1402)-2'-O)-methyltransferase [Pleomorphochaeta sp.]